MQFFNRHNPQVILQGDADNYTRGLKAIFVYIHFR